MRRLLTFILFLSCGFAGFGQAGTGITADKTAGCGPLLVHFAGPGGGPGSSGGGSAYAWDLGNGNSAAIAAPVAVYTQPGNYTVSLTVTTGGQTANYSQRITVYTAPTATFSVSATKVCSPTPIQFTSGSTAGDGAIVSWLWDFGDGTTSSVANGPTTPGSNGAISHSYQQAGVEGPSLTVTDSYGCTATIVDSALLTILPRMQAAFSEDNRVLCAVGNPVQFTNTSTGPGTLSYSWSFGDGGASTQTSPSYSYPAKGTYSVVLTATSSAGCVASDTQANVINVANYQAAFDVPAVVCAGTMATFADESSPAPNAEQWLVDGSIGATPLYPPMNFDFTTPGAHTITLTGIYGACRSVVTRTVNVIAPPPIPPFDAALQGKCGAPVTVNFLDHTPGAIKWAWIFDYNASTPYPQDSVFGGPANSILYGNNQTYDVQLTVTNAVGCRATTVQQVQIAPPFYRITETDGGPDRTCNTALTKSYSIERPGQLTSFTWNFGDGTTSTSPTPTHTFSVPGTYNVSFSWTDVNGCTGTTPVPQILISPPLNIDFAADYTTICAGHEDGFGGPLVVNDQALFTTWSFGDGTQAFSQDGAAHTYSQPGVYTVTLFVQNIGGCEQTVTKTDYITVLPSPTLGVSALNSCSGNRGDVTFMVAAGNGATGLSWDFGDGQTQTTPPTVTQVVHSYTTNGSFNVSVTATNGTCGTTATLNVNVLLRPVVTLSIDKHAICPGDQLTCTLLANTGNTTDTYYNMGFAQFQYGDSTNFQGYFTEAFEDPYVGDYTWWLSSFGAGKGSLRAVVTNALGCADTTNFVALLIGGSQPGFTVTQPTKCYQEPLVFTDTTTVSPGNSISSVLWNFGDGASSSAPGPVSHQYSAPGSYNVTLTVQDASGCPATSASTMGLVAVAGPQVSFATLGGTVLPQGSTVQFNNTSNTYGTGNVVWTWDFGDGTAGSNAMDPTHVYPNPGTYVVKLSATDASVGPGGCSSAATLTLTIQPFNTAFGKTGTYVSSGSCPPVLVQFSSYANNYTAITWDFGDGNSVSNVTNPSHVYTQPGRYLVSLTVDGTNGQTVKTVDSVIVLSPAASLAPMPAQICVGQADTMKAVATRGVTTYSWDFGDGSLLTGRDTIAGHTYLTPGAYTARMLVTDSLGCTAAVAADDVVEVHAIPKVSPDPSAARVCLGSAVALGAGSPTATQFSWSPAAGLDNPAAAAPMASPLINTLYKVVVADAIGCSDSGSVAVIVVRPDTVAVSPDSTAICPGKEVALQATGAYSYSWFGPVDGLSGTNIAGPVARPGVTTAYEVAGSDQYGCFSDTVRVIVTVLQQPEVNAGPDLTVLAETPVTIEALGSADVVSWQWTPATWLSCSDCAQPVCTPKSDERYVVTVTGADGCVGADTVQVQLLCDEARVRIPDAFTPNGDGHNDRWTILGAISIVSHLVIYDRWGVKVFEADHFYPADPRSGWDGTMGGRPAPAGVYAYEAEMQCPSGGLFVRKGTVVLIR